MWEEERVVCTKSDGRIMFPAPPMYMTFYNRGDTKGYNIGTGGMVAEKMEENTAVI